MKQIVEFSNDEQTQVLNRILSKNKDKYSLYDIFDVDVDNWVMDIINFNFFNVSGDKQKYFDECLENLYSLMVLNLIGILLTGFKKNLCNGLIRKG